MVRCNKDVAMHKKTFILLPYMNETAFCQSRYPEKGWKMSKTTAKTAAETIENVEFPSFDASKATYQIRAFAEKGVEQSK